MKFLTTTKDGGAESTVWAHTLIEIKSLFSIILLRFEDGSRDAYHSHAFDCISWVLKGLLIEQHRDCQFRGGRWLYKVVDFHWPSWRPVITRRSTFHMVRSAGRTWVLTFRGPWSKTWKEARPDGEGGYSHEVTLTHGRKEVSR
jgi:hypothetical protein